MTESTTTSPHDAVLKPLCSHPKPQGIFSKYVYQNHCASFATCKPYAWNPLVLLKKVYALTTRMFLWSVESSDGDGYIYCVIEHRSFAGKEVWLFG
ncbi:Rpn family recombination-promoting nuclease/putative transposase [Shigella flexneri]